MQRLSLIHISAGTFGYELDLMKMSEEEKKTAREQILKYKEMEHLVQTGDYYRLVNPFKNNNHVLWQFVSKDKKETIVCGVRLHSEANPHIYLFYPQGLDCLLYTSCSREHCFWEACVPGTKTGWQTGFYVNWVRYPAVSRNSGWRWC